MARGRRQGEFETRRHFGFEVLEERRLLAVDFGDAQDLGLGTSAGNYRTLANDNGPSHSIVAGLHLGASVDGTDGGVLQNDAANADDVNGALPDDEDGVANSLVDLVVTVGATPRVNLWATNTTGTEATLYGWIDYDGDGVFENSTERATIVVPSSSEASLITLTFPTVPDGFQGETYARFRLSTDDAAANATGPATDGEVEDFRAVIALPGIGRVDSAKTIEITSGVHGGPIIAEGHSFGKAVTVVGDLDGNGVTDIVVSSDGAGLYALFMEANGTASGSRRIEINGDPTLLDSVDALAGIGDINSDGVPDLAVGARYDKLSKTSRGTIYVLMMDADGTVNTIQQIASGVGGGPQLANGAEFGASLASIGDLDGDGVSDLAVGADRDSIGALDGGAVYVLFMNPDGTAKNSQMIASDLGGAPTMEPGFQFGSSIASLGDLNGDGIVDIAVGVISEDELGGYSGAVLVMHLNTDGTVKSTHSIARGVMGSPPLDPDAMFGASVANIGDLDGDGFSDLAVGATHDSFQGLDKGAMYILLLNADGSVKGRWKIAEGLNGGPSLKRYSLFGTSITSLGDIDGDGIVDLVVGAIGADDDGQGDPFGTLHVMFLQAVALDFGDAPDTGLGTEHGNYLTTEAHGGPSHVIVDGLYMGASVDGDSGWQQDNLAVSDSPNGMIPGDEDGLANPMAELQLTAGNTPRVNVWVTNTTATTATLYGWIDYNADGVFDAATERSSALVPAGTESQLKTLEFPPVPIGLSGTTYARFRLSTDPAAAESTGPAADGEVEDYQAHITIPTQGVFNTIKTTVLGDGRNGVPDIPGQGYFGRSLASLGDLDGDGVTDLVVGTEVGRGQLKVLLMNRNGTVKSAQSIVGYRDEFGIAVASLGDIDGDGVTDIAVGDEKYVFVIFLNRDGSEKNRQFVTAVYGVSLAGLGDFDGDGTPDLAIGVYDWADVNERGEVRIVLLNSDGTLKSQQIIGNEVGGGPTLLPEDEFGGAVASIGDLDGDGISDIAVGATGDGITPGQTRDDTDRGAVHVLLLNANGTVKSSSKITGGSSGDPILGDYDRFGAALAFLGDLDGDGYPDLAVGAYEYEVDGVRLGKAYLLYLNGDGTVKRLQLIPFELANAPALDERIRFGYAVASLGDLDGDGVADLAVGAPRLDFEHRDDGAVLLLHLQPATLYGDYNGDGSVDAADYSVWRNAMGQTGLVPYSGSDGSGNGSVGPEDFVVWKAHFGETIEQGAGSVELGASGTGEEVDKEQGDVHVGASSFEAAVPFGAYIAKNWGSAGASPSRWRAMSAVDGVRRDLALMAWVSQREASVSGRVDGGLRRDECFVGKMKDDSSSVEFDAAFDQMGSLI